MVRLAPSLALPLVALGDPARTVFYVLTICATLLTGGCAENAVAFDSIKACEAARAALKGEFEWARCEPASVQWGGRDH
jgi:hypothetical protein